VYFLGLRSKMIVSPLPVSPQQVARPAPEIALVFRQCCT
jgi:hypothetical protein